MDRQLTLEQEAIAAQREGDYQAAIQKWEELVALNPRWECGTPYYCVAGCYEMIGDHVRAEAAYRQALAIDPRNSMFTEGLASHLEARRRGYI